MQLAESTRHYFGQRSASFLDLFCICTITLSVGATFPDG